MGNFSSRRREFPPILKPHSLPIARFAGGYIQSVIAHPHMQDWIAGAQEEDWVLEQYEREPATA